MRLLLFHVRPEGKELAVNPDHIVRCMPIVTGGAPIGTQILLIGGELHTVTENMSEVMEAWANAKSS
jgi:uncharacterized protein YlzI (FlbEa/FlbD family)